MIGTHAAVLIETFVVVLTTTQPPNILQQNHNRSDIDFRSIRHYVRRENPNSCCSGRSSRCTGNRKSQSGCHLGLRGANQRSHANFSSTNYSSVGTRPLWRQQLYPVPKSQRRRLL